MAKHPNVSPEPQTRPSPLDYETAKDMLLIDFEQAFVVHNIYRESERDLFKLSLRILALPPIMAGTLLSAGLVSSTTQLADILQLPIIWLALIAAGLINSIVVRSSVTTDRVQTEAKHQVNRLRSLYLHALSDRFPPGWQPVWGPTNAHLDTRLKFKAAVFSPLILGSMNAVYVAYGTDRLLAYQAGVSWHLAISVPMGLVYFFVQLETTWNIIRELHKKTRPGGRNGKRQSMAVPTRKG